MKHWKYPRIEKGNPNEYKKNRGADFERLVTDVFSRLSDADERTHVEMDQKIIGPEGERQFDVTLKSTVAGHEILTIVECKDYKRAVNVTVIDAFHSKLIDVNANKGIIASRNGFTNSARKKAKRLGISLCEIDELENKIQNPLTYLPVVIWHVSPKSFKIGFSIQPDQQNTKGGKLDVNKILNGEGIMDLVRRSIDNGVRQGNKVSFTITEETYNEPLYLMVSDRRVYIKECEIAYELEETIQYGFAKDLPRTIIHERLEDNEINIFFEINDTKEKVDGFQSFENFERLPSNAKSFHIRAIGVPDKIDSVGSSQIFGRKHGTENWEQLE